MREKIIVSLFVMVMLGLGSFSVEATAIEAEGAWLFDGDVADATANGHNATLVGVVNPYTNDHPRILGADYPENRSILLDGVNDYVDVPASTSLHPTPITIEAWVKPMGPVTTKGIVTAFDSFYLGVAEVGGTAYATAARVDCQVSNWSTTLYSSPAATFVSDGWHKIGFTYDGSTVKVYLDGQLRNSLAFTGGDLRVGTSWIRIGGGGLGGYFWGLIDEVRIIPRALSSAEILAAYSKSLAYVPSGDPGLVLNSGFESVDSNNHPTDWNGPVIWTNATRQISDYNYSDGSGGAVAISVDSTVSHSGSNSLKMVVSGTNRQVEFLGRYASLSSGISYTMSGWIKTDSLSTTGNGATWALRRSDPPGTDWHEGVQNNIKGTKDWTYYERTFTWGASYSPDWGSGDFLPSASHSALNPGTGTVWFDDLRMEPFVPFGIKDMEEDSLWLFDGNVADETTNHHHAAFSASYPYTNDYPNIRSADYPANRSILLDGVDDYVNVPVTAVLQPKPITVEAWIKPAGAIQGGASYIVYAYDGYDLGISEVGGTTYKVRARVRTTAPGNWSTVIYGSTTFVPGAWHKIGLTYDGALVTAYLDGQPVGTQAWTGDLTGPAQNQWIRMGNGGTTAYFRGQVDEVSIVPRALSAAEILARYTKSRTYGLEGTTIYVR